ncbi:DNA-3-methyladenine glycosylase II [Pedobacter cryoconitis]|uniref:DNA-3-methyladenine glycosylase family protein n=1 Tax=Pedobacter cryoconitis TaxID=188932 RepID=UPI0016207A39|nr:DNA-3-methyladenine glycosylase 2 family protein [Pedobacter cryoconitis]MBB6270645.1 DNA-3-methyladenine glycosylase II [Pedobacter cryoconitis]
MSSIIVNEKDISLLIQTDQLFAEIHHLHQSPPNWSRPPGFTTLAKIILEQQVSLSSAHAHFLKLEGYIKEFTPANILKLSDDEMRNCQISRQKSKYLRELSNAILHKEIDLEEFPNLDEVEIRKRLTSIKGIGHWTADVYLMFCLGAKDILPLGDIAIVNTLKELTGAKTKEEMLALSEKWKPFRSLATYFLWHHYLIKRNRQSSQLGYSS